MFDRYVLDMTMLTSRAARRRLVLITAIAGVMIPSLAACATPGVCTAIGWLNSVNLTVTNAPEGTAVIACAGEDCKPEPVTPGATIDPSAITASRSDGGVWRLDVGMSEPEFINVTVLDSSGAAVATEQFEPDWKRVGGSEQCGGPAKASDLTLAV